MIFQIKWTDVFFGSYFWNFYLFFSSVIIFLFKILSNVLFQCQRILSPKLCAPWKTEIFLNIRKFNQNYWYGQEKEMKNSHHIPQTIKFKFQNSYPSPGDRWYAPLVSLKIYKWLFLLQVYIILQSISVLCLNQSIKIHKVVVAVLNVWCQSASLYT